MSPASLDPRDARAQVVTAPAGSGKTTLLVYHYLRHLERTSVERIVAITFTRKAASELATRIARALRAFADPASVSTEADRRAQALHEGLALSPALARRALQQLPGAPLCTVDAFALSLVQEFLLHAHFELGDGSKAHLDGPVEGGADTAPVWEAAARAQVEALGASARVVLRELSLGEAICDVALLARAGAPKGPSAAQLAEQLAGALVDSFQANRDAWRAHTPRALSSAALEEVRGWLEARKGRPPAAFLSFVAYADEEPLAGAREEAFRRVLGAHGFEPGSPLRFDALAKGLNRWSDARALARSDEVRAALTALASASRDDALRALAKSGALGFDELLQAATALCRRPPPALAARYDVLMVDELQDTNPTQLAFYRTFAAMRPERPKRPVRARAQLELFGEAPPSAAHEPLQTFFVGDARQSIYRFRQADPHGWRSLVERARAQGRWADLEVNYRSSELLVDAQKRIIARLCDAGSCGVDRLDALRAAPDAPRGLLEAEGVERPVLVVDAPEADDADEHALAEFAGRLKARWNRFPQETAAVLVRTWEQGERAAQGLRDHGLAAQLTGDRALLAARAAVDLRQLLRALLDPTDDLALVGLLKHPSIGLSDRGLALLREGGAFGRIFAPDAKLGPIPEAERDSLDAARAVLRRARARLGRESTAGVLEWVVAELHWRPIIAASPEGADGVGLAQLELLLEMARQREAGRVDPQAVADALAPESNAGGAELPVVQLAAGPRAVTVTTVFAAKGLEFDHVALLEVHKDGNDGVREGALVRLCRRREQALLGLVLDPAGGLTRVADPIALFGQAIGSQEATEEGLRLFYVGLTRAAKSVTLGIRSPRRAPLSRPLREALTDSSLAHALAVVPPDDGKLESRARPERARAAQRAAFGACWAPAQGLALGRPSDLPELGLDLEEAVEDFRRTARIVKGRAAPQLPSLAGLEGVPERIWGELVHGWLERWAFCGEPSQPSAASYLEERWRAPEPLLARWLIEIGLNLRDGLPGFAELLRHRLHFEWPLLGVEPGILWSGRSDLVVERPGRELVVVDFKAGASVPTSGEIPHLRDYAAQLSIYRRILEAAGYRVAEVGLVFVRGASWVRLQRGASARAA